MTKFKDKNNQVHEIEEGFEHLLPSGVIEITEQEAIVLLAPPPLTKEQYIQSVSDAVQVELDKEAKLAGYDSILTAVTYAAEPSQARFQNEGKSFRKWRSDVWAYCYGVLAQYEADLLAYPLAVADYDQYLVDLNQYTLDLAAYDADILAAVTPTPTAPTIPTEVLAPVEVVAPTLEDIITNIPVRA